MRREDRQRQERGVYRTYTTRIPCAFSETGEHEVTLAFDKYHVLKGVKFECEHNPPSEEDAIVLRSLSGSDKIDSCADFKEHVVEACVLTKTQLVGSVASQCKARVNDPALLALLLATLEESSRRVRRKTTHPCTPDEFRQELREDTLRRVVRGLSFAASGDVRITALPRVALEITANYRIYRVAEYAGHGAWRVDHAAFMGATKERMPHVYDKENRKSTCVICNKRVRSISTHEKSQRHIDNASTALLRTMEQVGVRLKRKDWRK